MRNQAKKLDWIMAAELEIETLREKIEYADDHGRVDYQAAQRLNELNAALESSKKFFPDHYSAS